MRGYSSLESRYEGGPDGQSVDKISEFWLKAGAAHRYVPAPLRLDPYPPSNEDPRNQWIRQQLQYECNYVGGGPDGGHFERFPTLVVAFPIQTGVANGHST